MDDSTETLIEANARIQERADQLAQERAKKARRNDGDATLVGTIESLKLARTDLERQLDATGHELRRNQIRRAMAEVDRRIAETHARLKL